MTNPALSSEFISLLRCPFCWGDFCVESTWERLWDISSYGTLQCDCSIFPIINGIPVLDRRYNSGRLVQLLKQGQLEMAASECLAVDLPAGYIRRALWKIGRKLGTSNGLMKRFEAQPTFRKALKMGYRESSVYYEYMRCRFSDPTFIAGEWLIRHMKQSNGWILDIPAGAGHFTWILQNHHYEARIVAADISFFNLLLIKTFILPDTPVICVNANFPLPFKSNQIDGVVSSDGWHYLSSQALFLTELMRISKPDPNILFLHVHNRNAYNYTPGNAFTLVELAKLFSQLRSSIIYQLWDESLIIEHAMRSVHVNLDSDCQASESSNAFDIWIGDAPLSNQYNSMTLPLPAKEGRWMLNPLYVLVGRNRFVLKVMNKTYMDEFRTIFNFLPKVVEFDLAKMSVSPDSELVEKKILLFIPNRF